MSSMLGWLGGHAWTIGNDLRHRIAPARAPACDAWRITVDDAKIGAVRLTGLVRHELEADTIVLVVHGLGGDADSSYCIRAARAVAQHGWSCLRINLRGADHAGEDIYHAGLASDLDAVLRHPDLDRYARRFVIGYSLGGHVTLRLALDPHARVHAVAAIGAPLDLAATCRAIDAWRALPYRAVVLASLRAAYRHVATRHGEGTLHAPASLAAVARVRTLHAWDDTVVVPRHGFDSVAHYHATQSVGPRLAELAVPAIYVGSRHDPMVPASTVAPFLSRSTPQLTAHMLDVGGHVGFPARLALDDHGDALEPSLLRWLDRASSSRPGG
jgi:predicted alpha/beta-fold hydrolase